MPLYNHPFFNRSTALVPVFGQRLTEPVLPPIVPTDIAGCKLWLNPNDTASITHASNLVSQINDKSGNGNHATAVTTQRPTTNTRTINGRNALDFNGTANALTLPSGLYGLSSGANTLFVVFASDNTGDATQSLLCGVNATPGVRSGLRFTTTTMEAVNRTTSNIATTLADTRNTSTKAAGYRRNGTALLPFINGVQGTDSANSENFTANALAIGAQNTTGTTNRFDGLLGEIIWYDSYLSITDMNRVGNYLAGWGLAWTAINF